MSVTHKITRKEKLAKKLFNLAPAAQQELGREALKQAQRVVDTAKGFVTSDSVRDSGRARLITRKASGGASTTTGSINPLGLQRGRGRRVAANTVVAAEAAFTHPLAHLFEFGTAERVQATTGRRTGAMPRTPFLFPAFRMLQKRIKAALSRAITKSIKQVAKR